MDLTTLAGQATRRARLVEQVLLDHVQEQAIAELRAADPKGDPQVAVCWQRDGNASINGRVVQGRAGAPLPDRPVGRGHHVVADVRAGPQVPDEADPDLVGVEGGHVQHVLGP